MTNKKGKRKGRKRHKGKIKHDDPIPSSPDRAQQITVSVDQTSSATSGRYAQPSRRDDDLASPSTTTLLPDHESSPRGGQGDEINTRPTAEQAPSTTTLALHDARSGKQPIECPCNSCDDEDDTSDSSREHDDSSIDRHSEDHDDSSDKVSPHPHTVMPSDLPSSSSPSHHMVSPSTISTLPGYGFSPSYDHMQPAHNAGVLIPSFSSTTRSRPISSVLVNEHNAQGGISYIDAARNGMQQAQNRTLQHRIIPKEIRTAAPDNVEHHSTAPTDPHQEKTYVDGAKLPPALPASHRAATGSSGSTTNARDLAFLESQEMFCVCMFPTPSNFHQ